MLCGPELEGQSRRECIETLEAALTDGEEGSTPTRHTDRHTETQKHRSINKQRPVVMTIQKYIHTVELWQRLTKTHKTDVASNTTLFEDKKKMLTT